MTTVAIVLHVPGLWNSGPEHWQSHWERRYGHGRVVQADWDHPVREEWIERLELVVREASREAEARQETGPVVLVGHSLGCSAIAFWAERFVLRGADRGAPERRQPPKVWGALFVAPSDPEAASYPKEALGFAPMPRSRLPFPSIVVASSDDPYVTIDRATAFAASWGSRFVNAGSLGHMNSQSRLGDWPFGYTLLCELVELATTSYRQRAPS